MSLGKAIKKLSFTGLLMTLFFLVSCQEEEQGQQAQRTMPYPVVEIPLKDVTSYTTYPARIEGTVNSAIRAKVQGYITDVLVDEGQAVREGQPLFRLETQTLSEDAGAARSNVEAARVEVEKLKPLVEKGIISNVQLETAKARLSQAEASLKSIEANIGYATIRSPVKGYVGSIAFREGALVSPNDPTPLTTVSDIDEVYGFFSMNEEDYLNFMQSTEGSTVSEKVKKLPPVQLRLVNGSVYPEKGRIETVNSQVDPSTGTVRFRAKFPNESRLLASGNSGSILIPKTYENVPVVPEAATYEQQGRVYVYRVEGDSLAVTAPIEVLDRVDNLVVVSAGIKEGDKIVAKGVGKLSNNTPIRPQPVAFDSIANSLNVVFK